MLLPCVHMFAVAQELGKLTEAGSCVFFSKYVHKGYLLKNYAKTLKEVMVTLVDTNSLFHDGVMGVNMPVVQSGRPWKRRIRSAGENLGTSTPPKIYKWGSADSRATHTNGARKKACEVV